MTDETMMVWLRSWPRGKEVAGEIERLRADLAHAQDCYRTCDAQAQQFRAENERLQALLREALEEAERQDPREFTEFSESLIERMRDALEQNASSIKMSEETQK